MIRNLAAVALFASFGLSLWSNNAQAAKFSNQFSEFELPPQWACTLEGAEWVCQSSQENKKRDAIIVLAAKLKGDQDSLDQYRNYLNSPKTYTSVQGKPVKSEKKWTKDNNINNQLWIDSMHLESEIPGFYTRYMATVKADIGVLVTYSVNQKKFGEYSKDFDNMINTLKVFRKPGGINTNSGNTGFSGANVPTKIDDATVFKGPEIQGGAETKPPVKEELPWIPILAVVAIIGFIIWKRRQNQDE